MYVISVNFNAFLSMPWKTFTLDMRDVKFVSVQLNSVSMNESSCIERKGIYDQLFKSKKAWSHATSVPKCRFLELLLEQ